MNKQAFILPTLIITTTFVLAIGLIVAEAVIYNFLAATREQNYINSQFAADGGVDFGITQLNGDEDWVGTVGELELYNDGDIRMTYEVSVTTPTSSTKELVSVGRTYDPAGASSASSTKSITVELYSLSGGAASVVTGVGGLFLYNHAKIVGGTVYVNGELELNNNSQIGLVSNPVNVRVAHQTCPSPPDGTYPQVCAAGENGEPITMSVNANIYGDVEATNQTDGTNMELPGLTPGSPAPLPLPPHDRLAQIAAVNQNVTGAAASCTANNGTVVWSNNTKITGDVEVSKKCRVILEGDVWITGNLRMLNQGEIETSNSVGTTIPNIMIDGSTGLYMRNSSRITSNSDDVSPMIVTYYSDESCSIGETAGTYCDVTGEDLYDSRNIDTIDMDQNPTAPETIFYARWTGVNINNSGDIGSLAGQTVKLRNSGAITFGSSVPGVDDDRTWLVYSYRQS